jgi:hypothetical protein
LAKSKFLNNINATFINLLLIILTLGQKVYITLDFPRHPLSSSTLFNSCSATHLINSKDLLELKSFIKTFYNKYVKASSFNLLILKYSKKVIKKDLNSVVWRGHVALHVIDAREHKYHASCQLYT